MSRRPIVPAALGLVAALALAGFSGATTTAEKQRVVFDQRERPGWGTWTLLPINSGPVQADKGKYTWSKTLDKSGLKDGQSYRHVVSTVTFVGQNGTLVVREDDTIVSAAVGKEVVTGVWRVLRGTGSYENVKGDGKLAAALGFGRPDPWRYEGLLISP